MQMKFIRQSTSGAYLLTLFFLVSVVNFLDRQALSIVQEDIKFDLTLTDSQLGMLGLGFGLIHAIFALPIGRLADRIPRKTVLMVCMVFWSSATAAGGAAMNFIHLLLARMGVAAGEAGVTPTTYSMISDKFELKRRATAIAICGAGIPVGLMFSLLFGGMIADNFGWRWTFFIFGIPGIILAVLFLLTVKAPERGQADGIKDLKQSSFKSSLVHLLTTRSFFLVMTGAMCNAVFSNGLLQWIPSYYLREFELSVTQVGATVGPILGISSLVSMLGAAYLADRLSERDIRWYTWIVGSSLCLSVPFMWLALETSNYLFSMICLGVSVFFGGSMVAITNAMIQNTAPIQMRGMASAMKTVALSFVGYGLGGAMIGVLSQIFTTDDPASGLRMALLLANIMNLVAAALFFICASSLGRDIENAKKESLAATS